jgi:Lar family restriction alleviation protein
MDKKLKPCPFCGEEAHLKECIHYHSGPNGGYTESGGFYIECEKCSYQFGHNQDYNYYGDATTIFATKEQAIKAWNTRKAQAIKDHTGKGE